MSLLPFIILPLFAFAVIFAPFWVPEIWKKFGPGSTQRREELAVNDAILDSLTAHFMERRDLWSLTETYARCTALNAEVCILSSIFKVQVGHSKRFAEFSGKSKKRFMDAVNGTIAEAGLDSAKAILDKIEKSINERRENVVNMSARK